MLQEKIEKNLGSDDDADSWIPVDVSFIKVDFLNFDKNKDCSFTNTEKARAFFWLLAARDFIFKTLC